jgi:hypothetical protein
MCFTLGFVENFLIWLVIICLIVACVQLLVPFILAKFGQSIPPIVMTLLTYLMWAAILIFIIVVLFDLIGCISAGGGFRFGLIPRS